MPVDSDYHLQVLLQLRNDDPGDWIYTIGHMPIPKHPICLNWLKNFKEYQGSLYGAFAILLVTSMLRTSSFPLLVDFTSARILARRLQIHPKLVVAPGFGTIVPGIVHMRAFSKLSHFGWG